MNAKPIRVYADTSVYGGVLDEEFAEPSRTFFEQVRTRRFSLVISPLVRDEVEESPPAVRALFRDIRQISEPCEITGEAVRLQQAYLQAGIIGPRWRADALHVAVATVCLCRVIVSWNFKHIVSFQRIPLYNGVNLAQGYGSIGIHTPQEVIVHEDEDV